jgi:hypothetical protein
MRVDYNECEEGNRPSHILVALSVAIPSFPSIPDVWDVGDVSHVILAPRALSNHSLCDGWSSTARASFKGYLLLLVCNTLLGNQVIIT